MKRLGLALAVGALSGCASRPNDRARWPFDEAELGALIESVIGVEGDDGPGVAVVVVDDGRIVVQRRYGLASIEHGVRFTPDHVVRLPYSEGREFIAIAAILMENDGLIRLDDSVRSSFPRLPEWADSVTYLDLIRHRSGFVDEWSALLLMHGSMANRLDESQFLRLLYDQPAPEVEPGAGYMYSNSDYGLLRLALDRLVGGDLRGYMKRRLFDPLSMSSTHLVDDVLELAPHHASFYATRGDGYRRAYVKTSPGGDYVIATTASDLVRWSEAHSDPSSEVSRAVARLMHASEPIPGLDGHYAFGHTVVEMNGVRIVRHEGVLGCNYLTRIPSESLSVITFGNRDYEPEENRAIVSFLLAPCEEHEVVRLPREPISTPVHDLTRYAGRFVSTSTQSWESRTMARELIEIEVSGDALELVWPSWGRFRLVPVRKDAFSWHADRGKDPLGMLLEFSRAADEGSLEFNIRYSDGYPVERFERLEEWTPTTAYLESVIGMYYNSHLDYYWKVVIDEAGQLAIHAPTIADIPLEPCKSGEFLMRHEKFPGVPYHVWLRFHTNDSGEVTHLTAWNPRLLHHRFDRR